MSNKVLGTVKFSKFLLVLLLGSLLISLTACAPALNPERQFAHQVGVLVEQIAAQHVSKVTDLAPAAVVSANVLQGKASNRLEEYVAERLTLKLR